MFIRRRSTRAPGTGRLLLLLLCLLGALAIYLARAAIAGPDDRLPHPVAAEFRLASVDGRPAHTMIGCRSASFVFVAPPRGEGG